MKKFGKELLAVVLVLTAILGSVSLASADTSAKTVLTGWDGNNYQYVLFGDYESGSSLSEGILWRVLGTTSERALLMSEYILATRPFDEKNSDWGKSDINKWLNGSFLKTAFASRDDYDALYNNNELGRVFLLSKGDLQNEQYGFSRDENYFDDRRRSAGIYDAINGQIWEATDDNSSYYTRTSQGKEVLYQIRSNGSIGIARIDRKNVGIRPAIAIILDRVSFSAGDGTIGNPFR